MNAYLSSQQAADKILGGRGYIYSLSALYGSTTAAAGKAINSLTYLDGHSSVLTDITHDSSGAPIAKIQLSNDSNAKVMLSLSDSDGLSVCIALIDLMGSNCKGVGIDVTSKREFESILNISDSRLKRLLFPEEYHLIQNTPAPEKAAITSCIFALKEASFKAMAETYRKYRQLNDNRPLAVSFTDFGIWDYKSDDLLTVQTRGYTKNLTDKENINLSGCIFIHDGFFGALACCC